MGICGRNNKPDTYLYAYIVKNKFTNLLKTKKIYVYTSVNMYQNKKRKS